MNYKKNSRKMTARNIVMLIGVLLGIQAGFVSHAMEDNNNSLQSLKKEMEEAKGTIPLRRQNSFTEYSRNDGLDKVNEYEKDNFSEIGDYYENQGELENDINEEEQPELVVQENIDEIELQAEDKPENEVEYVDEIEIKADKKPKNKTTKENDFKILGEKKPVNYDGLNQIKIRKLTKGLEESLKDLSRSIEVFLYPIDEDIVKEYYKLNAEDVIFFFNSYKDILGRGDKIFLADFRYLLMKFDSIFDFLSNKRNLGFVLKKDFKNKLNGLCKKLYNNEYTQILGKIYDTMDVIDNIQNISNNQRIREKSKNWEDLFEKSVKELLESCANGDDYVFDLMAGFLGLLQKVIEELNEAIKQKTNNWICI